LFYFASHIRRASKSGEKRFGRKKSVLLKKKATTDYKLLQVAAIRVRQIRVARFSCQKYQFMYSLVRLGKENVGIFGIFYGHFLFLMALW
jgi:hypothetical protein